MTVALLWEMALLFSRPFVATKVMEKEFATPSGYINQFVSFAGDKPRFNSCYKNAFIEVEKNVCVAHEFDSHKMIIKTVRSSTNMVDYKNVKFFFEINLTIWANNET